MSFLTYVLIGPHFIFFAIEHIFGKLGFLRHMMIKWSLGAAPIPLLTLPQRRMRRMRLPSPEHMSTSATQAPSRLIA